MGFSSKWQCGCVYLPEEARIGSRSYSQLAVRRQLLCRHVVRDLLLIFLAELLRVLALTVGASEMTGTVGSEHVRFFAREVQRDLVFGKFMKIVGF